MEIGRLFGGWRRHSAICSASQTKVPVRPRPSDHPTTLREKRWMTTAWYSPPSRVRAQVISPLDEGIEAGDVSFVDKAQRRLQEFTSGVATIELAPHSESGVKTKCDKAVLMVGRPTVKIGGTDEVMDLHHKAGRT